MQNRILETVEGYENAVIAIAKWATMFNQMNGENRMVLCHAGLEAHDNEGSGEFYIAVCLNVNEAESLQQEVYQIETAW